METHGEGDAGMRGRVSRFDQGKGYGFIEGEDGREYLVHFTAVRSDLEAMRPDCLVEFAPVVTPKGLQADDVRPVDA